MSDVWRMTLLECAANNWWLLIWDGEWEGGVVGPRDFLEAENTTPPMATHMMMPMMARKAFLCCL